MTREKLDKAKRLYETANADQKYVLESLFPELKESEDEKIRKEIVRFIQMEVEDEIVGNKWIAWLKKQGEKSVNKLQVSDKLYEHIRNTCACIDDALSSETLADINDYLSMAERSAQSAFDMIEKQGEQKDNLSAQEAMDIAVAKCFDEQKQDVNIQINPSEYINDMGGNGCYLKNTTQTSAWSEEDERNLQGIIDEIAVNKHFAPDSDLVTYDRYLFWLNSLRTKNTWKPSEEQMDDLETAVSSLQSNTLESLYQDLKREKNYE